MLVNPDIKAWFDKLQGERLGVGSAPRGGATTPNYGSAALEGIVRPTEGGFGFSAPAINAPRFRPEPVAPNPGERQKMGSAPPSGAGGGGGRDLGGGARAAGLRALGQSIEQSLAAIKEKQNQDKEKEAMANSETGLRPLRPFGEELQPPPGGWVGNSGAGAPHQFVPSAPTFTQPGVSTGKSTGTFNPLGKGASAAAEPGAMGTYRDAIANIESSTSGGYGAVNSRTGAVGRYQVLPSNVGPWTQAALGKTMTPEEFRASPEAQDAVFNQQFGQAVQKYGQTGAANWWFTGKPNPSPSASDQITTAGRYAQRFNDYVTAHGGQAPPTQVASSATPSPDTAPAMIPGKEFDPNNTKGVGVNGTPYDASGKYVGYESSADTVAPNAAPAAPVPSPAGEPPLIAPGAPQTGPAGSDETWNNRPKYDYGAPAAPAPPAPPAQNDLPPLINGGQPGVYSVPGLEQHGMNDQGINQLAAALGQTEGPGAQDQPIDQSTLLAIALAQGASPDLGDFSGLFG